MRGDEALAIGHRGKDSHAEFNGFSQISDKATLIGATLYTTLEPCTGEVRREPEIACTNLIIQHQIGHVYVGMLDPNQGVCGKGLIKLQVHGIDVSLFDPDLANELTALNIEFIRAQQALGVQIPNPEEGASLTTFKTQGRHTFRCRIINLSGRETRVVVVKYGKWWPQSGHLIRVVSTDEYEFAVHFGSYGPHDVHVVRLSDLGMVLFDYYKAVVDRSVERRQKVMHEHSVPRVSFDGDYTGIPMTSPPRGLDIQASVSVDIVEPPAA